MKLHSTLKPVAPLILVADDNEVNMLLVKSIFRNILPNAKLEEAENGLVVIEKFKVSIPDIIFMDVRMPEKNGYDATSEIRGLEDKVRTPIIALTAGTGKGEREKCLAAGMDDFLSKPVIQDSMLRAVRKWLPIAFTQELNSDGTLVRDLDYGHFNRKELLWRLSGSEVMLQEVLILSKINLQVFLKDLNAGVRYKSLQDIAGTANKLKGLAITSCFDVLTPLAAQLAEQNVYDEGTLADLINKVSKEIDYVLTLICEKG